jgi:hypothetical protein
MTPQMTPANPMAASQKYTTYIVPFFALSGLCWAFGLVLYWVTTNVWTLGQQYVLFKRYAPTAAAGADATRATAAGSSKPLAETRYLIQARAHEGSSVSTSDRRELSKPRARQTGEMAVVSGRISFKVCNPSGQFVFVSYARKDEKDVYPELLRIHSLRVRVWYDEGIEPGVEWTKKIATALENAAVVIVMITPNAVASQNIKNEINFALKKKKPVQVIYLVKTQLPSDLELQIGTIQAIERWHMDEDSYARKLAELLAPYASRRFLWPIRQHSLSSSSQRLPGESTAAKLEPEAEDEA